MCGRRRGNRWRCLGGVGVGEGGVASASDCPTRGRPDQPLNPRRGNMSKLDHNITALCCVLVLAACEGTTMFATVGGVASILGILGTLVPFVRYMKNRISVRGWRKHVIVRYRDMWDVRYNVLSDPDQLDLALHLGPGPWEPVPRLPLMHTWDDMARHIQVWSYGGPDLVVKYKGRHVGTIRVGYEKDKPDVWQIGLLRPDGTRLTSYHREYRGPATDVYSGGVRDAVDELHKHFNPKLH